MNTDLPPDAVHPLTLGQWHAWLEANHQTSKGVWFVGYKKAAGKPRIEYEDAVAEALCWGWIDSVLRPLDDERAMLRYTPRKKGSGWARTNKDRLIRLEAEGRIQPAGRKLVESAKADGSWTLLDGPEAGIIPDDLQVALEGKPGAEARFQALPAGEKKRILTWIAQAKQPATRARRIAEAVRQCRDNRKMDQWKPKETK